MPPVSLKIGLIDADRLDNKTRHPNLALMKISNYCKKFDHECILLYKLEDLNTLDSFDLIIISKVFTFTELPLEIKSRLPKQNELESYNLCIRDLLMKYSEKHPTCTQIAIGGTGFFDNGGRDLHPAIEHMMPDYNLYNDFVQWMTTEKKINSTYFDDYLNYSIGFMTRGCFRKCPFCVNKKYKRSQMHAHVSEFLDENRPKIYLWDDNILANSHWRDVFDELDSTNKPYQFRQGLDLRLMTDKRAERISRSHYYGDTIFAFDNVDDYTIIKKKLHSWRKFTNRTTKLYVLCAFDPWIDPSRCILEKNNHLKKMYSLPTQRQRDQLDIEGIFIRIELLMKYGCLPYIMRYQNYLKSEYKELYIQIARWCNQPQFFKKKSFAEFCIANQRYSKTNRICAPYKAYLDFKKDRPDIVDRYFNLRYEDLNAVKTINSYGREATIPCIYCNHKSQWDLANNDSNAIMYGYYSGSLNQLCIYCRINSATKQQCRTTVTELGSSLKNILMHTSFEDIIKIIDNLDFKENKPKNIPFIKNLELIYSRSLDYFDNDDGLIVKTNQVIVSNSALNTYDKNKLLKLLMISDLVWKDKTGFHLTPLGIEYTKMEEKDRIEISKKLVLTIPIIQQLIRNAKINYSNDGVSSEYRSQSKSINQLLQYLKGVCPEMDDRLERIKFSE